MAQQPSPMSGVEAYTPQRSRAWSRPEASPRRVAPFVPTFVLGVLAGAFIALGAVLSTIVGTGSELGSAPPGGSPASAFSLGLILVVVAGAELFTGNNLIVMSLVDGKVTVARLLRNWAIVYAGNFVGAVSVAVMVWLGDGGRSGRGAVGVSGAVDRRDEDVAAVQDGVRPRDPLQRPGLPRGVARHGRQDVVDKVFAIIFPIAAFVAAGFEHSIANMYFIPQGLLLVGARGSRSARSTPGSPPSSWRRWTPVASSANLTAATLGNVIGGGLLVGLVYWFVYLRPAKEARDA